MTDLRDAIRTEWAKLRTQPGTGWLCAAAAALIIAISALISGTTHIGASADPGVAPDLTKLALAGVDLGQAVIAVLAVLFIGEEYTTGMIRTTFTAMPRRPLVLAGKAVSLSGLVLVTSAAGVAGSIAAGRYLLPQAGLDPAHGYHALSLADAATARAAAGSVLYLVLVGLLALGVTTVIRDVAAATGTVLSLLYLPLLLAQAISDPVRRHLEQIAPMTAGLAVQATSSGPTQVIGPWAGLAVMAAWAVGTLLVGGLSLVLRDA